MGKKKEVEKKLVSCFASGSVKNRRHSGFRVGFEGAKKVAQIPGVGGGGGVLNSGWAPQKEESKWASLGQGGGKVVCKYLGDVLQRAA